MSDSKAGYSIAAKFYARIMIHGNMLDAIRYYNSKIREEKYNKNWKKHMVNLNDIVNRFTPGAKGKVKGVKFVFENSNYIIKADMPSGYLRIYDKKAKMYTKIDGTPSRSLEETHFKIMKRKEMRK
ncbi:hypothetical protein [Agathobacter ruminis]|uniref:Uncharacterized protein n=1 Tax=Agathobacter ruminis TaxID=1712665 RepID=A0A2G3E565_9FIRM|nr:hypothetical protein [Agathobacter ruminis]MDC7301115.1 hypothetical protein [Agathobacter ruminis]PHU38422.1 hypothetical protein CSX02_02485 [Agathobacter ruminis]